MKKIILILIVGCFMVSAVQAVHWTFDEQGSGTATTPGDIIIDVDDPPDPNGTLHGSFLTVLDTGDTATPTYAPSDPRYNPFGSSLAFDADYDMRLVIDDVNAVDVDLDTNWTLEADVFLSSDGVDPLIHEDGFMYKTGSSGAWWLRFDDDNGRTNGWFFNYPSADSGFKADSGTPVGYDQWVHVAIVRDAAASEFRIYHNYDLVLTDLDEALGASFVNDGLAGPLTIGTIDPGTPGVYTKKRFNGAIDFIKISDTALDPADFVQPIGTPTDPNAPDGATLVPLDQVFTWTPISGQTILSQTVTLSDTPDLSNVLETISPAGNSVTFASLEKGKTYYWAVDTLLDFGTDGTWLQPGEVWSFSTPACVFGLAEGDLDDNCTVNIVDFSIMAGNWLRTDEYE